MTGLDGLSRQTGCLAEHVSQLRPRTGTPMHVHLGAAEAPLMGQIDLFLVAGVDTDVLGPLLFDDPDREARMRWLRGLKRDVT